MRKWPSARYIRNLFKIYLAISAVIGLASLAIVAVLANPPYAAIFFAGLVTGGAVAVRARALRHYAKTKQRDIVELTGMITHHAP